MLFIIIYYNNTDMNENVKLHLFHSNKRKAVPCVLETSTFLVHKAIQTVFNILRKFERGWWHKEESYLFTTISLIKRHRSQHTDSELGNRARSSWLAHFCIATRTCCISIKAFTPQTEIHCAHGDHIFSSIKSTFLNQNYANNTEYLSNVRRPIFRQCINVNWEFHVEQQQ